MKILISSESYWPNYDGGAIFERNLVKQLIKRGHEVCLVVPGARWRSYEEDDQGSHIYRTASAPLIFNKEHYRISYYARSQVLRALNEFRPDIIHVNTMALTGMSLIRHGKKRNIPMVATNHLMPENVLMSLPTYLRNSPIVKRQFWKMIVRFHENFVAVTSPTPSAIKLLKYHGTSKPLFSISNGINTDEFTPQNDKQSTTKQLKKFGLEARSYVLYLGRVNAEKRLDMLVNGYKIALERDSSLTLVIAGSGNRIGALKKLTKELGIEKKVIFTGFVTDKEKLSLLQNALLYAITSPAELQSIATMEAMACGLPIIAVDVVALHELCHDGKNGFLVAIDDDQGLADAILKITQNSHLRQKFSAHSRDFVVSQHSLDSTCEQFLKLYSNSIRRDG